MKDQSLKYVLQLHLFKEIVLFGARLGLHGCARFSRWGQRGPLSSCGGFSCYGTRASVVAVCGLGHCSFQTLEHRLCSFGTWT